MPSGDSRPAGGTGPLPLRIAQRASARHGWPLRVIDDAADDPSRDQPERFVRALRSAVG